MGVRIKGICQKFLRPTWGIQVRLDGAALGGPWGRSVGFADLPQPRASGHLGARAQAGTQGSVGGGRQGTGWGTWGVGLPGVAASVYPSCTTLPSLEVGLGAQGPRGAGTAVHQMVLSVLGPLGLPCGTAARIAHSSDGLSVGPQTLEGKQGPWQADAQRGATACRGLGWELRPRLPGQQSPC